MKRITRDSILFLIGGLGYVIIELLWRGRSHITMFFAGGICFLSFLYISQKFATRPLLFKALLAALSVTVTELIFGLIFNVIFKMHIWDYSEMPFNLFGQVCLLFSFLWGLIALIALPFVSYINRKIEFLLDFNIQY